MRTTTKILATAAVLISCVLTSTPSYASTQSDSESALLSTVREMGPATAAVARIDGELESLNSELAGLVITIASNTPLLEQRVQQARSVAVGIYIDGDTSLNLAALSAADNPLEYASRVAMITPTAMVQALELQPLADLSRKLKDRQRVIQRRVVDLSSARSVAARSLEKHQEAFRNLARKVSSPKDGLSILGPSTLTAQELAQFVRSRTTAWRMPISIEEFAQMYLTEAAAEGVRGDVLFIQGVQETGWYRFEGGLSTIHDNNFAGINACDSCRSATSFDSIRMGVRAHVELVRAYADEDYTSKNTALPYAYKVENIPVRGCCATWAELGRYWASAFEYSKRVLWMWEQAVTYSGKTPEW